MILMTWGFILSHKDGCRDLVGDVMETDTSVVLTFILMSFFVDWANYALVPILGNRFFIPDFSQQHMENTDELRFG